MHIEYTTKFNAGDTAYFVMPDLLTVQSCKVRRVIMLLECEEDQQPHLHEYCSIVYSSGIFKNYCNKKMDDLFYSERQTLDSLIPKE